MKRLFTKFTFKISLYFLITGGFIGTLKAQETYVYKKLDTLELSMIVFSPEKIDQDKKYPAMIFFFGGGWNRGTIYHFEKQAKYFAHRGMVTFLVDYRVNKRHGTTPFESLKDAKSAIRFIRENAERFNIVVDQIIASGGSAGGHLAAATSIIEKYNEESDDLRISSKANALVLFNPVFDNGPGGFGFGRIGEEYIHFSPLHNLEKGTPPTIIFLGTNDNHIPVETAKYYKVVMDKVGSRCDLHLYKDQPHGFFNAHKGNGEYFIKTVLEADKFLCSLGYLEALPDSEYLNSLLN